MPSYTGYPYQIEHCSLDGRTTLFNAPIALSDEAIRRCESVAQEQRDKFARGDQAAAGALRVVDRRTGKPLHWVTV